MAKINSNKIQLNSKPAKGRHSKSKTSVNKHSKNYVKPYKSQGR